MQRCLLLSAVFGSPLLLGFAPAPVSQKVKPGQIAVSKPDRDRLVTMLRPIVTRLHIDDPFRVALHWALEKGEIPPHRDMRPFARFATLRTMLFLVTTPDGKKHERKADVKVPEGFNDWNAGLYHAPTFLLTLSRDGLSQHPLTQPASQFAWVGKKELDLGKPGIYKVRVSGTITDGKAAGIPFESEETLLEIVGRDIRSQKEIEEAAAAVLRKKTGAPAVSKTTFLREDKNGNRIVLIQGKLGMKWSFVEHAVEVKPDGNAGKITDREVFTCVAQGTPIETEHGSRPIENVRPGDRVWGWTSASRQRVLTTVRVVRQSDAGRTLLFGAGLRVTANHPLWASGAWKPAGEVHPEDRLLNSQLHEVKAGQVRLIEEAVRVYDLTVDAPHCYFAGGFLIHNKDRAYSPRLDDPWYSLWPE